MSELEEHSRRRNDASLRMELRFEEFLKDYEQNQKDALCWRRKIEGRLDPLDELYRSLKKPVSFVGWLLALLLAGGMMRAGSSAWTWVRDHVH